MAHNVDTPTPTAQEMLALYLNAEKQILSGQIVRMDDGSTLTYANLADVTAARKEWQQVVNEEIREQSGSSIGVKASWSNQ